MKMTFLDIAKFWMDAEIDKTTPMLRTPYQWLGHCWIWKGSTFQKGYGKYFLHQQTYRAHRVAYFICYGEIPKNKFVCHKCDNPKCVNPLHLFLGSPKENTQDMILKGRLVRYRSKAANTSSKYSGISFRKETGKWRARFMRNYTNILIGEFATEEEARIALDKASKGI